MYFTAVMFDGQAVETCTAVISVAMQVENNKSHKSVVGSMSNG